MLLSTSTLTAIRSGEISLAFRRWRRPTVKAGGGLLTPAGRLRIGAVEAVDPASITPDDARRAGFTTVPELIDALGTREGDVYRVELGPFDPDPRIALRESEPSDREAAGIGARLERMDGRSDAPWTLQTLRLIARRPGVRAADLASEMGWERLPFKANVRKLKTLGLTISLDTGYELSPRGRAYLAAVEARDDV